MDLRLATHQIYVNCLKIHFFTIGVLYKSVAMLLYATIDIQEDGETKRLGCDLIGCLMEVRTEEIRTLMVDFPRANSAYFGEGRMDKHRYICMISRQKRVHWENIVLWGSFSAAHLIPCARGGS